MILAADSTNGVVMVPTSILKDYIAEGYQIDNKNFFDSLSDLNNHIISEIKSLRSLIKIHKEFGINR